MLLSALTSRSSPSTATACRQRAAGQFPTRAMLAEQRRECANWDNAPLISLVVPLYNSLGGWLEALLCGLEAQSYGGWECILVDDASTISTHLKRIEQHAARDGRFRLSRQTGSRGPAAAVRVGIESALGDYVGVVDQDDLLEPDALFEMAKLIREENAPRVIYADSMTIGHAGHLLHCETRREFDYFYLLSHPYIDNPLLFRRDFLLDLGGSETYSRFTQNHELLLRAAAREADFSYLAKPLYRRGAKRNVPASRQQNEITRHALSLLNAHLLQAGLDRENAWVEAGTEFNFFRLRCRIPPLRLSVILSPHQRRGRLLEELLGMTPRPEHVELEYLESDSPNVATRNRLAGEAEGDWLLWLSGGLEITHADWLTAMLELTVFSEVAAVGARLVDARSGLLQHAGLGLNQQGVMAEHAGEPEPPRGRQQENHRAVLVNRQVRGLSSACLLTRREAFLEVGGFAEGLEPLSTDMDLCRRLRANGGLCLYTPHARLLHHAPLTG